METTKFFYSDARAATTRGQTAIYAVAAVVSVAIVIGGIMAARARASEPAKHVAPNSLQAGVSELYDKWQREVLHSTPTPAPAIQPAQVQQATATPAPVAQVQVQDTPPPRGLTGRPRPPEAVIEQPTPAPAAAATPQQQTEEEWQRQALARSFATPTPAARATPDPIAARHAAWQSLHDGYVTQVRARVQAARTDAEKGQIQRDIAAWRAANPEPAKATLTPNENEIPIH